MSTAHQHSETCQHTLGHGQYGQTLDELDWERGLWNAAGTGDTNRTRHLLDKGVDPNVRDSFGYTPLHYASRNGRLEVCRLLLGWGACVDAVTGSGRATALHRAATQGHGDVVELLLFHGACPLRQDADGKTALHRAAEGGHLNVCVTLLHAGPMAIGIKDVQGRIPIECVPSAKHSSQLQELLLSP